MVSMPPYKNDRGSVHKSMVRDNSPEFWNMPGSRRIQESCKCFHRIVELIPHSQRPVDHIISKNIGLK
ncbi:hypothetical protein Mapa_003830 [Marchantia paleacea]|nr:hypothetical protein Mapa_003830 [Marchantia paleacea]